MWRAKLGIEGPKHPGARTGNTRGPGEHPGIDVADDAVTVTTPLAANPNLGDVETMLKGRGLDPGEWDVERVKVNEWEGFMRGQDNEPQKVKLEQLTAHLRRRRTWDFLVPAAVPTALPSATPRPPHDPGQPWLEWVGGDQQAGYHDEALHRAVCRWLEDVQPDGMSLTGDTVDHPTISRHPDRPHWNMTPQDCLDAGFRLLYEYCCAAPGARKLKLRGNHDYRIEAEMLSRAERLWGLRPAKLDGEDPAVPLYSVRRLLRLDELGIELVGVEGDKWELAEIELEPDLVVKHAFTASTKLARLGRDVIAGDSHRQEIRHVTSYIDGAPVVRTLMQVGLLARADGLGYTRDPDWQQGFGTVTRWPDGSRHFELARWDGTTLTWRGETWRG